MTKVLVTGGAGFIGSHLVDRLLAEGAAVVAIDNFDPFYDPRIKRVNIAQHIDKPQFQLLEVDIQNFDELHASAPADVDLIVHLAAKAGVRPSLADPVGYQQANVVGTQNLLEYARNNGIGHFVFASSSSVYGVNPDVPWSETDHVLRPISPYASTKVSGELLGHVYSHLFGIRFTALRFFTVYGPRQRPDLAIHKFARLMLAGDRIPFFGDGSSIRDYTYIDDIVDGVSAAMRYDGDLYDVFNLGNDHPVSLRELVDALEEALGVEAKIEQLPEQPGDLRKTWANIEYARNTLEYAPRVDLTAGLASFAKWIKEGAPSAEI
jgi:UDP-glucuronate 4-epimerase